MLNPADLMEKAVSATGLDDFGEPTFHDGLNKLIDAFNGEAELSDLGAVMAEQSVLEPLTNRLLINAWIDEHPEVEQERVERPIVIVGMSRSGTTALSHLLGKDPELRSLLRFEALCSVPPPESATVFTDPRYLQSVQADEMSELVFPELRAIHHDPPDAPVECNTLLSHEFVSTVYTTVYHLPSYADWIASTDLTDAYAYHERILKLLQSRMPGTWNLKGPQHGFAMQTLRRRYPDATLIATHRDPAVCAASTASLMAYLHSHTSTKSRSNELGEMAASLIEKCSNGLIEDYRNHRGGDRMLHVAYRDLVGDPIGTVRRLYDQMNRPLSEQAESAMIAHTRTRTQHRYGKHHYLPTDYGLDIAALKERYHEYRESFDVDTEGAD
jgi:hypothetical protein